MPSPRAPPLPCAADADKVNTATYYPLVLRLVRPGGLLVFDNALFYGQVVNDATTDRGAIAMRAFTATLLADARVSMSLLPVGDGTIIARKR